MNRRAYQKYNRYHLWWSKIEKNIIAMAILLFLVLYATQLVNFIFQQRGASLLSNEVEKLEGKSSAQSQTQLNTGTVELSIIGPEYANIQLYINGEYYSNFYGKTVALMVKNNDIIEINGIKSQYPTKVEITNKSQNVISPYVSTVIDLKKGFIAVGRVQLK